MLDATRTSGFLFLAVLLLGVGCGGSEPAPKDPSLSDSSPKTQAAAPTISATADIGGMNEDDVDAAFKSALGSLERCLNAGAKRVEFLGGSVAFVLKIDARGKLKAAYLEHSSLGDHATEACMLNALRAKSWPKPVGGDVGIAKKSFQFDPPNDVRPPTTWDERDAAPGLKKVADDLARCKQGQAGPFEATLYVGTDGRVLAASVTPPDEDGEPALECLTSVLEGASFPSPGSWPAKVTLAL